MLFIPVFYVAVFDPGGVYGAPLTPDVDTAALVEQGLPGKTTAGPAQGVLTITDRTFGYGARRTPSLGNETGIVVLRSD